MHVTYEIRTVRGVPVYAFDNEFRAKEELDKAIQRVGTTLRLVRITRLEEEVA